MKVTLLREFWNPVVVLLGMVVAGIFKLAGMEYIYMGLLLTVTALGSYQLIKESIESLIRREYILDYIAVLAILVGLITGEYFVAAIIALMLSTGRTLEDYGVKNAKRALTNLINRIPDEVLLWKNEAIGERVKIKDVKLNQEIFIRKGEVIPLDGILITESALTDDSSLTGEPYEVEKFSGDKIRSGTVNIGEAVVIKVTQTENNSTYTKIIEMVKKAQNEKAPLVRLADRYSTVFTITTLLISAFAYWYSGNLTGVLAVLVVATPCPLILATPIALIGGVNAAARKKIIIKKLASLETLSRTNTLIFDKTGTITLGVPSVINFENKSKRDEKELLSISAAIERNSLHPLAKAIVNYAKNKKAPVTHSKLSEEILGKGITGVVDEKKYLLAKQAAGEGMAIELSLNNKLLGVFHFEDTLKEESKKIIPWLKNQGFNLAIYTGDKETAAKKVTEKLGQDIEIRAGLSPEEKQNGISVLKSQGKIIAMVGDGINDAPALSLADVGMVFSNEEQTASSEAADIVFLGGDFNHVKQVIDISKKTIKIALQSIVWGIGISTGAMVLASVGLIPPVAGAILQEGIDIAVIINALRASKS